MLLDIFSLSHYFFVGSVKGYHWMPLHTINIYFLHGRPIITLVLYNVLFYCLCVVNKALMGSYSWKLLLDVHVYVSYWILSHDHYFLQLLDTVSL